LVRSVDPPAHADLVEPDAGEFQQRASVPRIVLVVSAHEHLRLIEVGHRQQGKRPLLAEDAARIAEPLLGLLVPTLKRAEPGQ